LFPFAAKFEYAIIIAADDGLYVGVSKNVGDEQSFFTFALGGLNTIKGHEGGNVIFINGESGGNDLIESDGNDLIFVQAGSKLDGFVNTKNCTDSLIFLPSKTSIVVDSETNQMLTVKSTRNDDSYLTILGVENIIRSIHHGETVELKCGVSFVNLRGGSPKFDLDVINVDFKECEQEILLLLNPNIRFTKNQQMDM